MFRLDRLIAEFDRGLRTVAGVTRAARRSPSEAVPESDLSDQDRRTAAALMRVNHVGEVCAQALYQGQAITARNRQVQHTLEQAAREETEHLAWTERRIAELSGRKSLLNPLWYGGGLAICVLAGWVGGGKKK